MNFLLATRDNVLKNLTDNTLQSRLIRGTFWSVLGTIAAQGMAFAATVFAAHTLGQIGYGELGMVQSTVGMFGVFAGFGIGLTATKHVAEFKRSAPDRAGNIIGLTTLMSLVLGGSISIIVFILAPHLASHVINAPHLAAELRISCFLLFFNTLVGTQMGVLAGFEAFKTIAKINFLRGLLNFPLVVVGVYYWGLPGAIVGLASAAAGGWTINSFAIRHEVKNAEIIVTFRKIRSELLILWQFSMPAFFSGAIATPVRWVANAILVNHAGGYAALGVFVAATQVQKIANFAGARVGAVLLPMMASKDTTNCDRLNRANILISWAIGALPALPLLCFPEIFSILFGDQYNNVSAKRTFVLVIAYTTIVMYNQGLTRVLIANSLVWWGVLNNLLWSILLLVSICFLKEFGAIGFASSFLIAYTLTMICFTPLYTHRDLVPQGTIISFEAGIIWIEIITLSCLSIFQFSIYTRAIALLFSFIITYKMFKALLIRR